jgi:hypothetical protein
MSTWNSVLNATTRTVNTPTSASRSRTLRCRSGADTVLSTRGKDFIDAP